MKTLNHIVELDPNEADAYFREATLFASPGLRGLNLAPDLEKAIVCGHKAVALSPENADYRITLADLFLRMGRDREAMDTLQPLAGGRHRRICCWPVGLNYLRLRRQCSIKTAQRSQHREQQLLERTIPGFASGYTMLPRAPRVSNPFTAHIGRIFDFRP